MFRAGRLTALLLFLFVPPALGQISAVSWNVDGKGSKPRDIAKQLMDLPPADVYALQEVPSAGLDTIWDVLDFEFGPEVGFIASEPIDNVRTMIVYSTKKLAIIETRSIYQAGKHRIERRKCIPPIACLFEYLDTKKRFYVVNAQTSDYHSDCLPIQLGMLSGLGAASEYPVIMAGTFDVGYGPDPRRVHSAFNDFLSDKKWVWERPLNRVDQEWADWDGDGINNTSQVISDFVFHAKLPSRWSVRTDVIVRENDFPPGRGASTHRPLQIKLEQQ